MSRPRTRSATPFYNETCPICQENIIEDLDHRDNPPVTLPCNHRLHSTCYHEYIEYGNNIKECPICKRRFQLGANNEPIETINENQETESDDEIVSGTEESSDESDNDSEGSVAEFYDHERARNNYNFLLNHFNEEITQRGHAFTRREDVAVRLLINANQPNVLRLLNFNIETVDLHYNHFWLLRTLITSTLRLFETLANGAIMAEFHRTVLQNRAPVGISSETNGIFVEFAFRHLVNSPGNVLDYRYISQEEFNHFFAQRLDTTIQNTLTNEFRTALETELDQFNIERRGDRMLINFNAYVNAYLSSNNDALIAQQRFIGDNAGERPDVTPIHWWNITYIYWCWMWNEEYNGQRMDNLASLRSNIQDVLNEIYNQMRNVFENLGGKRKTKRNKIKSNTKRKTKVNKMEVEFSNMSLETIKEPITLTINEIKKKGGRKKSKYNINATKKKGVINYDNRTRTRKTSRKKTSRRGRERR
jgi:hypothetical protein